MTKFTDTSTRLSTRHASNAQSHFAPFDDLSLFVLRDVRRSADTGPDRRHLKCVRNVGRTSALLPILECNTVQRYAHTVTDAGQRNGLERQKHAGQLGCLSIMSIQARSKGRAHARNAEQDLNGLKGHTLTTPRSFGLGGYVSHAILNGTRHTLRMVPILSPFKKYTGKKAELIDG